MEHRHRCRGSSVAGAARRRPWMSQVLAQEAAGGQRMPRPGPLDSQHQCARGHDGIGKHSGTLPLAATYLHTERSDGVGFAWHALGY